MMRYSGLVLLSLLLGLWLGCGPMRSAGDSRDGDDDDSADDGDDDDSADDTVVIPGDLPLVVSTVPSVGATDFFFASNLQVEWDIAPEDASFSLSLSEPNGALLPGSTELSNGGSLLTFDPDADLEPSSQYRVAVSWSSEAGSLSFDFETGPYGEQLDGSAEQSLIGRVFNLDLSGANFVQPPGVGPILQSQVGDVAILFTMTAESSFDAASQPGLHIVGVMGEIEGGQVSQDPCTETLGFTYGADAVFGTSDDTPAEWDNPSMELGPTNLQLNLEGMPTTIENLVISGAFHPELDDMQGGVFQGLIDTRPLAPQLDPEGGEDSICQLVRETVGVDCVPCNDDGTEPFCLDIVAEDVPGLGIAGMTITPTSCVDIITGFVADGTTCQEAAEAYDADADADGVLDGTYPGCPAYSGS